MSLLWRTATNTAVDADGNPVDSEVHYIDHHALADMYSSDFDVKMPHVMRELQDDWDKNDAMDREDYVHDKDYEHGGPRHYVDYLKKDIRQNGIKEPLTIRGGNVVVDGNHRGVAALELRHPKIPVRYTR